MILQYNVRTIRAAGLEARWTRTRTGAPIIAARELHRVGKPWYVVDDRMWNRAHEVGVRQAFEEHTALGDFFSVRA
jgi:hypothetical protein